MRTLLGAIRAQDGSREGDSLPFEDMSDRSEAWFDFCADTGDGGNSTYSIARCLAAPSINVGGMEMPRGEILVHGGDLAYPHPTDEVYEERLFSVYDQALPGADDADQLVAFKARSSGYRHRQGNGLRRAESESRSDGSEGSESLEGRGRGRRARNARPKAFMIPGNHDWIDGLDTYTKQVLHRASIGGWSLPQDLPYFAIHLPHGWWLFGIDLALEDDIDMVQYGYFARLADERMGPLDKVIIVGIDAAVDRAARGRALVGPTLTLTLTPPIVRQVTHCPSWLIDWFWGADKQAHKLLRQLINGPLRGRVKLRLAGDLHFYMRHEFLRYDDDSGKVSFTPYDPTPAGGSPGLQGGSPMGGSPLFFGQAPALDESEVRRRLFGFAMDRSVGIDNPPAEHLVVCGGGGAFLHPTHVFAPARFRQRDSKVGGEYRCASAFPTSEDSTTICRRNLHAFVLSLTTDTRHPTTLPRSPTLT